MAIRQMHRVVVNTVPPASPWRSVGYLSIVLATLLFGLGNVVQKSIFPAIDLWTGLGLRALVACIFLLPFAARELNRIGEVEIRALRGIPLVALTFCLGAVCQQIGAYFTSATNVGFLINASVVFTPVTLWLIGREPLPRIVWLAGTLCFIGAALMSGTRHLGFGIGDFMCLLAAMFYGLWIIMLERTTRQINLPATIALAQWGLPALIGLTLGILCEATQIQTVVASLPQLLFLGGIASGAGYLLAAKAQREIPACMAALCYTLEAIFGALFAYAMLGESLTMMGLGGAILILTSIALVGHVASVHQAQD